MTWAKAKEFTPNLSRIGVRCKEFGINRMEIWRVFDPSLEKGRLGLVFFGDLSWLIFQKNYLIKIIFRIEVSSPTVK